MARKKYKTRPLAGLLLFLGAFIFALILSNIKTIRSLELDFLDYRFQLRGPLNVSDSPIIILALDDQSDESTPERWPWPREYFAHVIENLNRAGVRVIGIDVEFEQADIGDSTSDDRLAHVLRTCSNVVLAGKISRSIGRIETTSVIPPYEKFRETGVQWGLVSSEVDNDGIYRRYLIALQHMDVTYSSFALQVLKIFKQYDSSIAIENQSNHFICGEDTIPKYDSISMLINYCGPAYTFPVYSFDNVLDDQNFDLLVDFDMDAFDDPGDPELGIPPGLLYSGVLSGKIVLIGSTMHELHDDFPTPFLTVAGESGGILKAVTPGVEVHANALQTILSKNYLSEWGILNHLILYFILGLLIYIIAYFLPTFWEVVLSIGIAILYSALSLYLFVEHNVIVQITTPILLILFSFVGNNVYQYVLSQREKRMIQGAFAHYVPEKVVADILAEPDKLKLGGEERIVTVLFSDVEGFTSISEKLTPTELVHLLNEYLTEMSEIVLANNGIIDKYEGDAIMAEFGVPVHYDNHAYMACKTALEMQNKLKQMRERWEEEKRPPLAARIGINTGEVIVGNMGSRDVFDYTVLGDHVNLGSRLEGANKSYGTRIMISEFTYQNVKNDFHTRLLDIIRVKGKKEPITVYELMATKQETLTSEVRDWLKLFHQGGKFYRSRKWNDAIQCFQKCLELNCDDYSSREYLKRCQKYKKKPPGKDWDAVTTLTEK